MTQPTAPAPSSRSTTIAVAPATRHRGARSLCTAGVVSVALLAAACGDDSATGSSNRGTNGNSGDIAVSDAYIVPEFRGSDCAAQTGDRATLEFVVTNRSTTSADRLTEIRADDVQTVSIEPGGPHEIPVAGSLTSTRTQSGAPSGIVTTFTGIDPSVRPGKNVRVTFSFAEAQPLSLPVPVEACPAS
ncbi:hypothetical protein ACXVUM_01230 [Williamsia sp. SKLECPSW1]